MPEKPPFDARYHLDNPDVEDDEALAMRLQQELLIQMEQEEQMLREEEMRRNSNFDNRPQASTEETDMELLIRLQQEEMDELRNDHYRNNTYLNNNNYRNDDRVRNDDIYRNNDRYRNDDPYKNDDQYANDFELARRIQHEEALDQRQNDYQNQLEQAQRMTEQSGFDNHDMTLDYNSRNDYDRNVRYDRIGNYDRRGKYNSSVDYDRCGDYNRRNDYDRSVGYNSRGEYDRRNDYDRSGEYDRRGEYNRKGEYGRRGDYGSSHRPPQLSTENSRNIPVDYQNTRNRRGDYGDLANRPPQRPQAVHSRNISSDSHNNRNRRDNFDRRNPPQRPQGVPSRNISSDSHNSRNRRDDYDRRNKSVQKTPQTDLQNSRIIPGDLPINNALDSEDSNNDKTTICKILGRSLKPKKPTILAPIPPRPQRSDGPLPYSSIGSREVCVPVVDKAVQRKKLTLQKKNQSRCAVCNEPTTSYLVALDKKYHPKCFRCAGCHEIIDPKGAFAFMKDDNGDKHPLHRHCYAELYGVKCVVCKQTIPTGPDGKVSFVKHPFFDNEVMCPHHAQAEVPGRRCTGCHRFEPFSEPFAELGDVGRCVCYSCCRTVVVDSNDAQPLWNLVINFFRNKLKLPIWNDMKDVPILITGYESLNSHMQASGAIHGGSSQILTRGLCLTEHQSGKRVKLSSMKFNKNNHSFQSVDVEERGFTFFQIPDACKKNPDASVTAILCLSGLPRELAASVLAHEGTHAWIKLHPAYKIEKPIPPQVEEGCAQLVAMLFLADGLGPPSTETFGDSGPSDAKLRQYFQFSIETDDNMIYGDGYRKAAAVYAEIGIEALLSHVVLYQEFPKV